MKIHLNNNFNLVNACQIWTRFCKHKSLLTNIPQLNIKKCTVSQSLRLNSNKNSTSSTSSKVALSRKIKQHTKKNVLPSNLPRKTKWNSQCLIPGFPYTLSVLLNDLCSPIGYNIDKAIEEVILAHNNMIKNHGVQAGTARYNAIRLYAILMIEGRNPEPLPRVALGKRDR